MTRWSTILHNAPLLCCDNDKSIYRKIRYTPPGTGFPKTPISEGLDFYSGLCAYKVYIAHVSDLKIVHKRQFTFPSKFLCKITLNSSKKIWSIILHIAPLWHWQEHLHKKSLHPQPCNRSSKTPISEGLNILSRLCASKVSHCTCKWPKDYS